jgi:PKD repeat protein
MLKSTFLVGFLWVAALQAVGQTIYPCFPPSKTAELDINNVKTPISSGPANWSYSSIGAPGYTVPKDSGTTVAYTNNLWFGGLDPSNNLIASGSTYDNEDTYPGPVGAQNTSVYKDECDQYDRVWSIYKWQVEEFVLKRLDPGYDIPEVILSWPAHGNIAAGHAADLAPFFDSNNDGIYDPYAGDYPFFDLTGTAACDDDVLLGDQCTYSIYNVGNGPHFDSGGDSIAIEIHEMAFAYWADDAINNTTFYRYKLFNRSNTTLSDFYIGMVVDGDVGCGEDDFVRSDVTRGFGYFYNGDAFDDDCNGALGYGIHPAAFGIDVVQGPDAEVGDGVDNDHDGTIDEANETIALTTFVTYSRPPWGPPAQQEPSNDIGFYNFLRALWLDNTPVLFGITDYTSTPDSCVGTPSIPTTFMYPEWTDTTYYWATNGVPTNPCLWTEETAGNYPADRRASFGTGPFTFAPGQEKWITYGAVYARDMNGDNYDAVDSLLLADDRVQAFADNCFIQGCVSPKPEMVYHNDSLRFYFGYVIDGTTFSWDFGDGNTATTRFPTHTYEHGGFYNVCLTATNACGTVSFCENVFVDPKYETLPGVELMRIEGDGNGSWYTDLTYQNLDSLFDPSLYRIPQPIYKPKRGPVNVMIYDTNLVVPGTYQIQFTGVDSLDGWKLYLVGGTDTVYSNEVLLDYNHQQVSLWGLELDVQQQFYNLVGSNFHTPVIGSNLIFADTNNRWLTGVSDQDHTIETNWIRSGRESMDNHTAQLYNDYVGIDDDEFYEQLIDGQWAPYSICAVSTESSPIGGVMTGTRTMLDFSDLVNVDIIFTDDTSKWTRCAVVEMQENTANAIGGVERQGIRSDLSVDKMGNPDGTGNGMSWFPGYAVNVESGERLNMVFGEDSYYPSENATDMIWNPTSTLIDGNGDYVFGGKHYVYVFINQDQYFPGSGRMPAYQGGNYLDSMLHGNAGMKIKVWRSCAWVGMPMLENGQSLLDNKATVQLRVNKPYIPYQPNSVAVNNDNPLYQFTINANALSIPPVEMSLGSALYPNPFSNEATLVFSNPKNELFTLNVFDSHGKLIDSKTRIRGTQVQISNPNAGMGIYFYHLVSESGEYSFKGKMIITK